MLKDCHCEATKQKQVRLHESKHKRKCIPPSNFIQINQACVLVGILLLLLNTLHFLQLSQMKGDLSDL